MVWREAKQYAITAADKEPSAQTHSGDSYLRQIKKE